MLKRLEIAFKKGLRDAEGERIKGKVSNYFGWDVNIRTIHVITFDLDLSEEEFESIRKNIFSNPVIHISSFKPLSNPMIDPFEWIIWVGFRPGVRDTAGSVAIEAISDYLGRPINGGGAYTSKIYEIKTGDLNFEQVETITKELLANELIQQWKIIHKNQWDPEEGIGFIIPKVIIQPKENNVKTFSITSDEILEKLSKERNLALHPQDIPIIRLYFNKPEVISSRRSVGLYEPTDVELEAISQARSDHCNHNTFKGKFEYLDISTGERQTIDNLFKTFIEAPTLQIQKSKDWVVSVLWDNAGVAKFDEDYNYVITGETHNSPSNMEAYGGALTGIVGVYRDIMGTGKGAKMIGGLYGYCVAPSDYKGSLKPHLHPRRLLDGVVEGVRDGGNKHGVPTLFGNLLYHPSYLGKCLVFVASIGIMPKTVKGEPCHEKRASHGDLIIMCGGRVGKDGIHGVTASSEAYSESTPVGHVQIGDPYTQKKMHDFLLEARDEGLISFITDNGGGGLSSSVGESCRIAGGAYIELDKVPLKYEGLDPWEIWVSESQERMTVSIKPEHLGRFMELSKKHEVESTVIGRYENSGKLHITYNGKTCAYLDISFFEEAFPQWQFEALWLPPEYRGLFEPVLKEPEDYGKLLNTMLSRPNIRSREWIHRQYDHEVQGGSVIKYFVGRHRDMPSDAVVVRPILSSRRAIAVTQVLHPSYGIIDTYHMVAVTIDESVRRLLSVGGKLETIGGVDNFCWPSIQYDPKDNPDGKYKAAQLVRANMALRDYCLAFGIPLLSGKDSMYVDGILKGAFGERHKVSGLPVMQFTATTIVEDLLKALSMEVKVPGDEVYIVGLTKDELGGSEYYELFNYIGLKVPKVSVEEVLLLYQALEEAISKGLVASCHGVYRGGLGVHLALVSMAGWLGIEVDLRKVPAEGLTRNDQILFSESAGRFIVTVSSEHKEAFEKIFSNRLKSQNIPVKSIGRVIGEKVFRCIGLNGEILFEEPLERLRSSWSGKEVSEPPPVTPLSKTKNFNSIEKQGKPRALVLTGFGLNCDYETAYALECAGAVAERVHLNELLRGSKTLKDYQIFVIDGGFSWGDDHGAGTIMGCRIREKMADEIMEFFQRGGLILGICNGFQVLVNMGLLPGRFTNLGDKENFFRREVALINNDCGHFLDMWVWLKANPSSPCVFTKGLEVVEFPVRHAEGKFYADRSVLEDLERNNQIALIYCFPDGSPANGKFPYNPNGSLMDIAGICDITGRIMGLMPHPEAFNHITNHPHWTLQKEWFKRSSKEPLNEEGLGIKFFKNAVYYWK